MSENFKKAFIKTFEKVLEEPEKQQGPNITLDNSIYISDVISPDAYRIIFDNVKEPQLFSHTPREHRLRGEKPQLNPDYTVPIPAEFANKIGWQIGDDLIVDIYDEDNAEIIIAKKFKGKEAKEKFRALRNKLYANK